jgi:drug/metabolite transporter (DMT)-like permease
MILATSSPDQPQNPGTGILLLVSLVAAVIDWRYKRRGGVRPTAKERIWFAVVFLVPGVFLNVWGIQNSVSGEALGRVVGTLLILYFAVWEFGRWRVRRKNPR